MTNIDVNLSIKMVRAMAQAIAAAQAQLTTLDSTVGDGDHGVNMSKATRTAAAQVEGLVAPSLFEIWRTTGKAIQDSVGGASGLIFGAFFIGAARTMKEKTALTLPDVAEMMAAGLAAVQKRGKAQPGDKTMVDALVPAVEAAQLAADEGLSLAEGLARIAIAAQSGAEATTEMVAQHGRAKFLGERSQGHQDAGATSLAVMVGVWGEIVAKVE